MTQDSILGCLLGTAVGDAIGLPYEGLSRQRAHRLLGPPTRHRLVFGHGMVSDDTEHSRLVAQALIASGGDPGQFQRQFAIRLRYWLLGLPAGVGWATLRALLRLWMGGNPERSGVFSAGNGPAMRAAIFGAALDNSSGIRELVRCSSRLTHTDPKAEYGALAIALAARLARQDEPVSPGRYLDRLATFLPEDGEEMVELVRRAVRGAELGHDTPRFAEDLGLGQGVGGYVYHSVPVAIYAWFRHPRDLKAAVQAVVGCGGDTDTTAAMVGGIVGSGLGKSGIPPDWLEGLWEWPCTTGWMERLAGELADSLTSARAGNPPDPFFPAILLRNLFFLILVLFHGFRRLGPPY